jgi:hypothetical protein
MTRIHPDDDEVRLLYLEHWLGDKAATMFTA